MKSDIHPKYFTEATVICACGNKFTTGSTKEHITVEVCYKCHPLYTGEHRFLDVKGRVETFKKKMQMAATYKVTSANKKNKKGQKDEKDVKSLKELLSES
jgi:large subunit ribosomal protein L31